MSGIRHGHVKVSRQLSNAHICRLAPCHKYRVGMVYRMLSCRIVFSHIIDRACYNPGKHLSRALYYPSYSVSRLQIHRYLSTTPESHPWTDYDKTPTTKQTPQAIVPVDIPDDPKGVIKADSSAAVLFQHPGIFVVRQLEMLNLFIGYEQANRYRILDAHGTTIGYLLEEDMGFVNNVARQVFKTHRAFRCTIMDASGNVVLRIHRPFSFINSRIYVIDEQSNSIIGEAQQEWHPWRRKYNLFQRRGEDEYEQFAKIDTPFLSWEFMATTKDNLPIASIDRNFAGIGRELFTDTGQYNLRFENVSELLSPPQSETSNASNSTPPESSSALVSTSEDEKSLAHYKTPPITFDQRAILLAAAVCIDFDYFTRHSGGGFPIPLPFGLGGFGEAAEDVGVEVPPDTESNENSEPVDEAGQNEPTNPWDSDQDANPFGEEEVWDNEEGMSWGEGQDFEDDW